MVLQSFRDVRRSFRPIADPEAGSLRFQIEAKHSFASIEGMPPLAENAPQLARRDVRRCEEFLRVLLR